MYGRWGRLYRYIWLRENIIYNHWMWPIFYCQGFVLDRYRPYIQFRLRIMGNTQKKKKKKILFSLSIFDVEIFDNCSEMKLILLLIWSCMQSIKISLTC